MKRGRKPAAVGEVEAMAVNLWSDSRSPAGFLIVASEMRGASWVLVGIMWLGLDTWAEVLAGLL